MKNKNLRFATSILICCSFAGYASADTIDKALTGTDLSVGASWDGGVAPGASDIAKWKNNTIPGGAYTLSPAASSTTSWSGLNVVNATSSPVTFTGGNTGQTLDLGADGLIANGKRVNIGDGTANTITLNVSSDQAWTVNSRLIFAGGDLTVGGGVTPGGWTIALNSTNTGFNSALDLNGGSKIYDLSKATISGPGNMMLRNSDSLSLSAINDFTGIIEVRSNGVIDFSSLANAGNPSSFGAGTGDLLDLGGSSTLTNVGVGGSTDRAITHIGTNTTITFQNNGTGPIAFNSTDAIASTGTGSLKLKGSYADGDNVIAQSFTTTAIEKSFDSSNWVLSGANTVSDSVTHKKGVLELANNSAAGTAPITLTNSGADLRIGGGVTIANSISLPEIAGSRTLSATSLTPATVSGPITIEDTDPEAVRVDIGSGAKLTISGTISGSGTAGLRKQGDGVLELSTEKTYLGDTKVAAGTLLVSNPTGSATSSGLVSVANVGTVLAGTGTIGGDTTLSGGSIVSPAASADTVGTLSFGGDFTVLAASGYSVDATDGTTSDKLNVAGTCAFGGTISFNAVGHTFAIGNTYDVVDAATITGAPTISPATPGSGLAWDTSNFTTDGTISVIVGVADPYLDWASQIPNPAERGRTDDPDTDGLANLDEYLFGTSPIESTGSLTSLEKSGSELIIRWEELVSGGTYTLLESATLANDWVTSGATVEDDGAAVDGYQPKKASVTIGSGKDFYRVQGVEN